MLVRSIRLPSSFSNRERGKNNFFSFLILPMHVFFSFGVGSSFGFCRLLALSLSERRRSVGRMLNPLFMSSLLRTPSEKWIANRMECDFFFFFSGERFWELLKERKSSVLLLLLLRNKTAR